MSTQMNIKKGKIDSSQDSDSDMELIEEEMSKDFTVADLKCFESPALRNAARKVAEAARAIAKAKAKEAALTTFTGDKDIEDRDNTTNNSDTMGNDPLANGGINRDGTVDANGGNDTTIKMRWNKFRYISGMLVNDNRVEIAIVAMILVNAIMMGVATYPIVKTSAVMRNRFDVTDDVFLGIFTLELLLQFIYLGKGLFKDGWLVFDFIVISLSLVCYRYPAVRLIRIFRAFRIITRVKIMKDLILALLSVLPRMGAIFLMLLLIFYIFAVMFTQLFADFIPFKDQANYFENLEQSMLSLFQLMTMDEWAEIVRALQPQFWWAWLPLIIFVIISGFIVVNLIVAVICDAIGALDEKEKAKFHGHANGNNADSEITNLKLRDQLEMIEDQIGDLTRVQARTFHTLQYLTQELRIEKEESKNGATDAAASKAAPSPPEDNVRGNPQEKNDKRRLSGDRSRRTGLLTKPGYTDTRKSYRDTWKEEGSNKTLRRAVVSNFAKSARQLQKLREQDGSLEFSIR